MESASLFLVPFLGSMPHAIKRADMLILVCVIGSSRFGSSGIQRLEKIDCHLTSTSALVPMW